MLEWPRRVHVHLVIVGPSFQLPVHDLLLSPHHDNKVFVPEPVVGLVQQAPALRVMTAERGVEGLDHVRVGDKVVRVADAEHDKARLEYHPAFLPRRKVWRPPHLGFLGDSVDDDLGEELECLLGSDMVRSKMSTCRRTGECSGSGPAPPSVGAATVSPAVSARGPFFPRTGASIHRTQGLT